MFSQRPILNVRKTKEMVVDFRAGRHDAVPDLSIDGEKVERVDEYKYLGTILDNKLSFNANTQAIHKKCQSRLYCLQKLRSIGVNGDVLSNFYRCFIQSVLMFGFLCWYAGLNVKDMNILDRMVRVCGKIVGKKQKRMRELYDSQAVRKARAIERDIEHVLNQYFKVLPSAKRYQQLKCKTQRSKKSFVPQTISLLNK